MASPVDEHTLGVGYAVHDVVSGFDADELHEEGKASGGAIPNPKQPVSP